MSEESGVGIGKAPTKLLYLLREYEYEDATPFLKELAELTGIAFSKFEKFICTVKGVYIKSGYAEVHYEFSDWRQISSIIVDEANGIEWYLRSYDDYGIHEFYALNDKSKRLACSFSDEEQEGDYELVFEDISKWIKFIPSNVKKLFSDFISPAKEIVSKLKKELGIERNEQKAKVITEPVHLDCFFIPKIEESTLSELPRSFQDTYFYYDEDEYTNIYWQPISRNKKKTTEDLLVKLSNLCASKIYAYRIISGTSPPYQIYLVDSGGIRIIFDSNDLTIEEINYLSDTYDDVLGCKAEWYRIKIEYVLKIVELSSLTEHIDNRLRDFRKNLD